MKMLTSEHLTQISGGQQIYTFHKRGKGFRRKNVRATRLIDDGDRIPKGWHKVRN